MGRLWLILKAAVSCYLANDALSRGAAIAFCHVKAIGAACRTREALIRCTRHPMSAVAPTTAHETGITGGSGPL